MDQGTIRVESGSSPIQELAPLAQTQDMQAAATIESILQLAINPFSVVMTFALTLGLLSGGAARGIEWLDQIGTPLQARPGRLSGEGPAMITLANPVGQPATQPSAKEATDDVETQAGTHVRPGVFGEKRCAHRRSPRPMARMACLSRRQHQRCTLARGTRLSRTSSPATANTAAREPDRPISAAHTRHVDHSSASMNVSLMLSLIESRESKTRWLPSADDSLAEASSANSNSHQTQPPSKV